MRSTGRWSGPTSRSTTTSCSTRRCNRGRDGWNEWIRDWQQAWEDYTIERFEQVEIDEHRMLTIHRLRARGRVSGVQLERTDAQLWTFSGDRLARMDYYPDYRAHEHSWAEPATGSRSERR